MQFRLLRLWTFLKSYFRYFYRFFVDIDRVDIVNNGNQKKRYLLLRMLIKIIDTMNRVKSYFDMDCDVVCVTKSVNGQVRNVIVENKNLSDVVEITNYLKAEENMNEAIFLNFSLENGDVDTDMKHVFTKYKDLEGKYDHTLKNILKVEKIDINSESKIKVKKFSNGSMVKLEYPLLEVENKHINYFNEL